MGNLNILSVNHKSREGVNTLFTKIEDALVSSQIPKNENAILIAPDYALRTVEAMNENRPNTPKERQEIFKKLKDISKHNPKVYLLPGTMFWYENDRSKQTAIAKLSTPLYADGRLINEFFKKRSHGEIESAENYGKLIGKEMRYSRGDNTKNFLSINGNKIAVEICGDHGSQNVTGVDLEIILAYDINAGFYIGPVNNSWSRHAIVSDGYSGTHSLSHYDRKTGVIKNIKGQIIPHGEHFRIEK